MQALIPFDWQDIISQAIDWLHRYILVSAFLAQALCVLVLLVATRFAAPVLKRVLLGLSTPLAAAGPLHSIAVALSHVARWVFLLLLLWFARVVFNATAGVTYHVAVLGGGAFQLHWGAPPAGFTDVPTAAWYGWSVDWAKQAQVVSGFQLSQPWAGAA